MGFEIERRKVLITFAGTDYDGLEISCVLDVSLRELGGFLVLTDAEIEVSEWMRLAQPTWNVERDGQPVECTFDEMMDMPVALKNTIIATWAERAANPGSPLGQRSANGVRPEVLAV